MWVRKRSGHEEAELVIVGHVLVTEFDDEGGAIPDLLLLQDRFESRIQLFADVLQQDPFSKLDSQLHRLQQVRVRELACSHPLLTGHLSIELDVLVGLSLRIDHQWPSPCSRNNDSVLDRQIVIGKAANSPLLDDNRLTKDIDQTRPLLVRDAHFVLGVQPQLLEVLPELSSEGAGVAHHACSNQGVPWQELVLDGQRVDGRGPAIFLSTQTIDQLVCVCQLDDAHLHFMRQLVLLCHGGIVVGLKLRQLVFYGLQLCLCIAKLRHGDLQASFCVGQHPPLGLHGLRHEVILVHGPRPHAEGFTSHRGLLDGSRVEILPIHVFADLLDYRLGDVVLVELEEVIQQLLRVAQRPFLRSLPVIVNLLSGLVRVVLLDGLDLKHHADSLQGQSHTIWRLAQSFDFLQARELQGLQGFFSHVESRQSFIQILLGILFDSSGFGRLLLSFRLDFLAFFLRDRCLGFVFSDDDHHFSHLHLGLLQHRLLSFELGLHVGYSVGRSSKGIQALLQPVLQSADGVPSQSKHLLEGRDQFQVGRWSDVNGTPHGFHGLLGSLLH
mmetsp:Transcript_51845/g.121563  ORF Transcript_51845/g.121563 Transcript_51845/m.121563 type:complete len:554 (+) Transcript_51845:2847-4508(+)